MPAAHAPESVLFITPQMPSFRGGGLAMRAAATLQMLSLWSQEIHLLVLPIHRAGNSLEPEPAVAKLVSSWQCLAAQNDSDAAPSTYWSQALRGAVPAELKHWHEAWQERINSAIAAAAAKLVVVFRIYLAPYVLPALEPSTPVWLDVDELESNARARLAKLYSPADSYKSAQARMEAGAYDKLEKDLLPRFDRLFVASHREADLLQAHYPGADARVLPNSYPLIRPQPEREPDGKARLLFVGSFGYYPNVDAVLYFARQIMPIIKERCHLPVEIAVIGSGLEPVGGHPELPGLNLIGPVSETTPFYASSDAAIVPLRSGGGTRIKILEAFSHQRAVISTTLGAEGLNVADNVELRLTDDAASFADHCLELINDGAARSALAQRGYDFFVQHHGPAKLEKMIPALFGNWSDRS